MVMDTVTLNISLPKKLADSVDYQVKSGEYSSRSEFFRTLLRLYKSLTKADTKTEPAEFLEFKKRPLKEVEQKMLTTGKYSKKFVREIVQALKRESLYEDSRT